MPDRLGELPEPGEGIGFHGDNSVGQDRRGGFVVAPIRGGRTLTLPALPANPTTSASARQPLINDFNVILTGDSLLYTADTRPPAELTVRGVQLRAAPGPGPARVRRVEYRKVSPAELGNAKPVRSDGQFTLFRLPLSAGAKPVALASGLNSGQVVVSGNMVYWIDYWQWSPLSPNLKPSITDGVQTIPLLPSCNRLVRMSLSGGQLTVMETAMSGNWLARGSDGVFWIDSSLTSGPPNATLYYLANNRTEPSKLPDYRGVGEGIDCGNRVYWLQHADGLQHNQGAGLQGAVNLMSAPSDLSAPRVEATLEIAGELVRPGNDGGYRWLFVRQGNLYLLCAGPIKVTGDSAPDGPRPQSGGDGPPTVLYRVSPRPRVTLQKVTSFPDGTRAFYAGDDSLYATADELRENWFDWSPKGLMGKSAKVVYRYRLP